jgi:hypothetical protein
MSLAETLGGYFRFRSTVVFGFECGRDLTVTFRSPLSHEGDQRIQVAQASFRYPGFTASGELPSGP